MTDLRPDIDDIRRAAAAMQGVLNRTPLVRSVALGD